MDQMVFASNYYNVPVFANFQDDGCETDDKEELTEERVSKMQVAPLQ